MSHFSSVDTSPAPRLLIESLDRSAVGLGAMKRYVAYRLALLTTAGRVLDLGCGAGHDLDLLAKEGCDAVGLDRSAVMLAEARARSAGAHPLSRGVGEALPFRDGAFDGCRIERVLMHADDPPAVLAEVARVLRPGGVVSAFEPDFSALHIETSIPEAAALPATLSRCRWPDVGRRLDELVTNAGFEVVDAVAESSWGGRLARVPIDVVSLVQRAVDDGDVDADLAARWVDEQRQRDDGGTFRARWVKHLVIGWRPPA